jgi:hypothetical protein
MLFARTPTFSEPRSSFSSLAPCPPRQNGWLAPTTCEHGDISRHVGGATMQIGTTFELAKESVWPCLKRHSARRRHRTSVERGQVVRECGAGEYAGLGPVSQCRDPVSHAKFECVVWSLMDVRQMLLYIVPKISQVRGNQTAWRLPLPLPRRSPMTGPAGLHSIEAAGDSGMASCRGLRERLATGCAA